MFRLVYPKTSFNLFMVTAMDKKSELCAMFGSLWPVARLNLLVGVAEQVWLVGNLAGIEGCLEVWV